MKHRDDGLFSQSTIVLSDDTAGAYMGIRGEGACFMCDRARGKRRHQHLFQLQWIPLAASVSQVEKARTTASFLSNH